MWLMKTLKLGFTATKSNNPIIPAGNACISIFSTLLYFISTLVSLYFKIGPMVNWHWINLNHNEHLAALEISYRKPTIPMSTVYSTCGTRKKPESQPNQLLITVCRQLQCHFLLLLITRVVLVELAPRGRADWGSRGPRPHSCFSHSHFSKTVDFISCRPRRRTLLSAFSLLWFSVPSLFPRSFSLRVSRWVYFSDFYSLLLLPFFLGSSLSAVTWRWTTWTSQISPVRQNKILKIFATKHGKCFFYSNMTILS